MGTCNGMPDPFREDPRYQIDETLNKLTAAGRKKLMIQCSSKCSRSNNTPKWCNELYLQKSKKAGGMWMVDEVKPIG